MTQEEFKHIIPQLRPLMVDTGRKFFGNTMDAEDVAQESLIRLWHYCRSLDAGRNMQGLAVKVAKNVCIDMLKERQPTATLSGREPAAPAYDNADAAIQTTETRQEIEKAMLHLNPRERELLRARIFESKTVDEISQSTGIGKTSVKSMVSMAKKKIMVKLKQHLGI